MASSKWIIKHTNIDDAVLYIAKGCDAHPLVDDFIISELQELKHKGKVSLLPNTIFDIFHKRTKVA